MDEKNAEMPGARPRYLWPWFVLAAVILAVALAVVWMSLAVRRVREMRRNQQTTSFSEPGGAAPSLPAGTNAGPINTNSSAPAARDGSK